MMVVNSCGAQWPSDSEVSVFKVFPYRRSATHPGTLGELLSLHPTCFAASFSIIIIIIIIFRNLSRPFLILFREEAVFLLCFLQHVKTTSDTTHSAQCCTADPKETEEAGMWLYYSAICNNNTTGQRFNLMCIDEFILSVIDYVD